MRARLIQRHLAARARAVVDDHRLTEFDLHSRLDDACHDVDQPARGIGRDDGDYACGEALRKHGLREERDRAQGERGTNRRQDGLHITSIPTR